MMPQPGQKKQQVPNRTYSILDVCNDPSFHAWEISGATPSRGAQFAVPPCLPIAMPVPTPYLLHWAGFDPFPTLLWRIDLDATHFLKVRFSCSTPFPTINIGIQAFDLSSPTHVSAGWDGSFNRTNPTPIVLNATAPCYLPATLTLTLDPP